MFTRTGIRETVQPTCDSPVTTIHEIDAGTNRSYEVETADGELRLLKVGTRNPETFGAEPAMMRFVRRRTDIPVPRVQATGTEPLGYPFAVYEFVEGVTVDRIADLARETVIRLCREAGKYLSVLHTLDIDRTGRLDVADGDIVVAEPVPHRELLERILDHNVEGICQSPFADRADVLREMGENLLGAVDWDAVSPAVVHGDYRLDNLALRPDAARVTEAVLDWEAPTAVDPLWDVVMTGHLLTRAHGLSDARRRAGWQAFRSGYGALPDDRARWRFYELLGRMRLARHVDSEMCGDSAAARATRIDEHRAAFEDLRSGRLALYPLEAP